MLLHSLCQQVGGDGRCSGCFLQEVVKFLEISLCTNEVPSVVGVDLRRSSAPGDESSKAGEEGLG